MMTEAEAAACPPAALIMLERHLEGEVSAEIALMHLLIASGGLAPLQRCLAVLGQSGRAEFAALARLAAAHDAALAGAAALVAAGLVEARGADRLAATRVQYDRAVALTAEASVALYSLGDPAILARATAELAALLDAWGLLGPECDALDIGCGIGRLERALAPRLRHITGIDLSPAMVAEAERRCAGIANAAFSVCDGTGLARFAAARFDLILAIDSFPCMFLVAPELPARHIAEAAPLLRGGGALAIFNYSYRGDPTADRADIAAHARAAGLGVARNGTHDLSLWDGTSFLLTSPPRRR